RAVSARTDAVPARAPAPPAGAPPAGAPPAGARVVPGGGKLRVGQTMVGMAPEEVGPLPLPMPAAPPAGAKRGGETLLGVAGPGIAPLAPGYAHVSDDELETVEIPSPAREPPPPGYEPAGELGATMGPSAVPERFAAQLRNREHDHGLG